MFFSLAKTPDSNFPNQYQLGNLVLNTDAGWHQYHNPDVSCVYKGYVEQSSWSNFPFEQAQDHQYLGNFVIFRYDHDSQEITLVCNRWRGIVIWIEPGRCVSNFYHGQHTVWNDTTLLIDQDLDWQERKVDIVGPITDATVSLEEALQHVHDILNQRIGNFLTTNVLPLKVFCSGGIDSTLVWSYVAKHTDRYELCLEQRLEWDEFWCKNQDRIKQQFWAYNQIHHWRDHCVLTSGAPGDEFMLRSPTTVNLWCLYHDIDIKLLFKDAKHLHAQYFCSEKNQRLFAQQKHDHDVAQALTLSRVEFVAYLCNIILNDCQHWHLGNTLTFTPLRDLEIFKLLLAMPQEHVISQIQNSKISQALIEKNDRRYLEVLSDSKNTGEVLYNLWSFATRYALTSGQ